MEADITLVTVPVFLLLALIAGAIGGAIGGILVGSKALGSEVAAIMGALFGPVATVPGVSIGLIIKAWWI
jgi:hypothetical protein